MLPRVWRRWMWAIFALALVARQLPIAIMGPNPRHDDAGAGVNRQLAANLIEYGGFYYRDWDTFGPSSIQTPPSGRKSFPGIKSRRFGGRFGRSLTRLSHTRPSGT